MSCPVNFNRRLNPLTSAVTWYGPNGIVTDQAEIEALEAQYAAPDCDPTDLEYSISVGVQSHCLNGSPVAPVLLLVDIANAPLPVVIGYQVGDAFSVTLPANAVQGSCDCHTSLLYRITGDNGINGMRWAANAATHGPTDTMFAENFGAHVNGAADETVLITNNWSLNDADFPLTTTTPDISSQEKYWAWIVVDQPTMLRDTNGNTGEFITVGLGGCLQDPVPVAGLGPTGGKNPASLGEFRTVPPGVYQICISLSDYSVFGGFNLQASTDGGLTWGAFPMAQTFRSMPERSCDKVLCCPGDVVKSLDGAIIDMAQDFASWCPIECPVIDPKPLDDYEFVLVQACDDIDGDPANYVNVTQETVIVNGSASTTVYTDYGDDTNQAEYEVQGQLVDCASGLPIDPVVIKPECEDWEVITAYRPNGEQGVNVERWNANATTGLPAASDASDAFTQPVDYSGMPGHPNAPDAPIVVEADLTVLDNTSDQSQMRGWTYLYTTESIRVRERHGRAEAVDYYLGECCGEVVKAAVGSYPNTTATAPAFDVQLPAGIHYIGFEIFDFSAYSSVNYEYSTDNGVTWSRLPASWLYTSKPTIAACPAKYCPETNVMADAETGLPLGAETTLCPPSLCGPIAKPGLQCSAETFYRVNLPEPGVDEQQWTTNAGALSGAAGTSYKEAFSNVGTDGLPEHPNAPDATLTTLDSRTTNFIGRHDAQMEFYIYLEQPSNLREFQSMAETVGVWISDCGSEQFNEVLDGLYTNAQANELGLYGAGFYKVRLYCADFSANGIAHLRALVDGTWTTLPAYPTQPTVDVIKGWACDDGKFYSLDKAEVLTDVLCEDPRCKSGPGVWGGC